MTSPRSDAPRRAPALGAARQLLAAAAALASLVVVVPVAIVLLPLWAVTGLARRLARALEPETLDWRTLTQYEEEVGWKPRPGVHGYATDFNGDPFRLTTDARGWRKAADLGDSDLVVLGDSYAFGFGVDDDAFFARCVPGHRVCSIGAPGYGMVQPVLWLERLSGELSGRTVVWMLYVGNDLIETLIPAAEGHRAPFVAVRPDGSCQIVTRHVSPDPWPFPSRYGMDEYIDVCTPGRLSGRAFTACEYLVEKARDRCASIGADLVIMTVPELSPAARDALERALEARGRPDDFDEDLPERRIAEICDRLGVRRVALRDHLGPEDYLQHDFHWNRAGHARVAAVLADLGGRDVGAEPAAPASARGSRPAGASRGASDGRASSAVASSVMEAP